MQKKANPENHIPVPLRELSVRELFIITRISLHLLDGFINGRFKPNKHDRKRLSVASYPFYAFSNYERDQFLQRKKYRTIKHLLNAEDKETLCCLPEEYTKKIDALVEKYWPQIEQVVAAGG